MVTNIFQRYKGRVSGTWTLVAEYHLSIDAGEQHPSLAHSRSSPVTTDSAAWTRSVSKDRAEQKAAASDWLMMGLDGHVHKAV